MSDDGRALRTAVMQPYLFPYIGYMQLVAASDIFVLFDDVNFIKKGWINRNRILKDGEEYLFTLPLEKISQNKKINETFIFEFEQSKQALFDLIYSSYRSAPQAQTWMETIEDCILNNPETQISRFNGSILMKLARHLDLKTKFRFSSEIPGHTELRAQEKILSIVGSLAATEYYNLPGGVGLYDEKTFADAKVSLKYVKSPKVEYPQASSQGFLPNLSILDVLFNVPPEAVKKWVTDFETL